MSTLQPWERLSSEDISPSSWYKLYRNSYRLPNGTVVEDFYVGNMGNAAMIVALTPERKIVIVRQYKPGGDTIIEEFPAGLLKEGQTPEQAAKAELREEVGGTAEQWESLGELVNNPTKNTQRIYVFFAKDVQLGQEQELDATEQIEFEALTLAELDGRIARGTFNGSDSLGALALFRSRHPEYFT